MIGACLLAARRSGNSLSRGWPWWLPASRSTLCCICCCVSARLRRAQVHDGWRYLRPGAVAWIGLPLNLGFTGLLTYCYLFVGSARADAEFQMLMLFLLCVGFNLITIHIAYTTAVERVRWNETDIRRAGSPAAGGFGDLPGLVRLALGTEDRAALAAGGDRGGRPRSAASARRCCRRCGPSPRGAPARGIWSPGPLAPTESARASWPGAGAGGCPREPVRPADLRPELAARTPELAPLAPLAVARRRGLRPPAAGGGDGRVQRRQVVVRERPVRARGGPGRRHPHHRHHQRASPRPARRAGAVSRRAGRGADGREGAAFLTGLDDARRRGRAPVEIFVPLELLRAVEVVDTPGAELAAPRARGGGPRLPHRRRRHRLAVRRRPGGQGHRARRPGAGPGARASACWGCSTRPTRPAPRRSPRSPATCSAPGRSGRGAAAAVGARRRRAAPRRRRPCDEGARRAFARRSRSASSREARALKRQTALGSLQRFAAEARR